MKRRDFIRLSAAGAGAGLLIPQTVLAKNCDAMSASGTIYYTEDSPGRWSGKAATHLPVIEIEKKADKMTAKVLTPHEMKGYEHYIVKHVLLDKNYQFLDEKMFNPLADKTAESFFTLANYSGPLYALSMCNKHDLWLNSITV